MKLTEQEIKPSIWEKLVEQEVEIILEQKIKEIKERSNLHAYFDNEQIQSHSLMIETIVKMASFLAGCLYDFLISHQNKDFQLDEDAYSSSVLKI